jgi:8-oxo-dGTP pyrophosphatase MutT (NUDIX family)
MSTAIQIIALMLLGSALLFVLIALIRRARRKPAAKRTAVKRSVVYLVVGEQLLVMQQKHKGRLRSRFEVPKGKIMNGETALAAAHRECWEESGLRPHDLQLLMSFPTRQRQGKQRSMETWDAFWGTVPAGTSIPFDHRVVGNGRDRGRVYHYRLVPLDIATLHPPLDVPLPALHRALLEAKY